MTRVRILSRQIRLSHQVAVTLAGGAAAFVDSPHHKALPATHVAGGALSATRGSLAELYFKRFPVKHNFRVLENKAHAPLFN